MKDNIKVVGLIINFKDMVFIHGQMVENMKVNTYKTKNMAKVLIHGQLENNIQVVGKMANSTVKQYLQMKKERAKEESGTKVKEKDGLKMIKKLRQMMQLNLKKISNSLQHHEIYFILSIYI